MDIFTNSSTISPTALDLNVASPKSMADSSVLAFYSLSLQEVGTTDCRIVVSGPQELYNTHEKLLQGIAPQAMWAGPDYTAATAINLAAISFITSAYTGYVQVSFGKPRLFGQVHFMDHEERSAREWENSFPGRTPCSIIAMVWACNIANMCPCKSFLNLSFMTSHNLHASEVYS